MSESGSLVQESFNNAVDAGDLKLASFLIESGANIDAADQRGMTSLHYASMDDIRTVRFLVGKGANINAESEGGATPLMSALSEGRFDVARFLLRNGASANGKNEYGLTAMSIAIDADPPMDVVALLIEKGADPENAFAWAAGKGHLKFVKFLLENGAGLNWTDEGGYTALMSAALHGKTSTARFLLEMGADSEIRDRYQRRNAYDLALDRDHYGTALVIARATSVRQTAEQQARRGIDALARLRRGLPEERRRVV